MEKLAEVVTEKALCKIVCEPEGEAATRSMGRTTSSEGDFLLWQEVMKKAIAAATAQKQDSAETFSIHPLNRLSIFRGVVQLNLSTRSLLRGVHHAKYRRDGNTHAG